jgi:hypothetical protein
MSKELPWEVEDCINASLLFNENKIICFNSGIKRALLKAAKEVLETVEFENDLENKREEKEYKKLMNECLYEDYKICMKAHGLKNEIKPSKYC